MTINGKFLCSKLNLKINVANLKLISSFYLRRLHAQMGGLTALLELHGSMRKYQVRRFQ